MKIKRRTFLQSLAAAIGMLPFRTVRSWAQTVTFPGTEADVLNVLAEAVLPAEVGSGGVRHVVEQFERWVRDYRPGADMEHGYGFTSVRSKPPSPAALYMAQLKGLRSSLLNQDPEAKRTAIEAALVGAKIDGLTRLPDGKHVISDLMSFYFYSSEATDLCYRVAIERYKCRGLEGSDNPPPPIKGVAR